jgi:gentisate 1,2-dioxygenase
MTTHSSVAEGIDSLEELYEALPNRNYEPLWTIKGALTPEPATRMVPYLWHYAEARDLVVRAGDLISAEEADRRVLALKNPGTSEHELARATDTLWAAIQLVLPGEVAPAHRHTPAALRYMIEGTGAHTTVDGRRVDMVPGDVVVTPNWSWHEHGHSGEGPALWLDGLDLPTIHMLRLGFAEFGGKDIPSVAVPTRSLRSGELMGRWSGAADAPTLQWSLEDAEAALDQLRDDEGSPHDDLILEYRNPLANGPLMPTMAAFVQLIRPGVETKPHRHTASAVYHVVRGSGSSTIGDTELDWIEGDTFALPTWAEHRHANTGSEDALLFSFTDEPIVASLGLLREQAAG